MEPSQPAKGFSSGEITVPEETKKTANKIGYLTKRGSPCLYKTHFEGGKWKSWKKRYFVLKDNFLYYFAEAKDSIPKGVLLLDSVKIENADKQTKRKYCFSITTKKSFTSTTGWNNRTYFFQADSQEEMEAWINAISSASPGEKLVSDSLLSHKKPHSRKVGEELSKLLKACGRGDTAAVKQILENHTIDLSSVDSEGNTPLHWATVGGHVDTVRFLLERGANVELRSQDGFTPMHSVAQEDHRDVLKLLIDAGAKLDVANTEDNNNTTLHYAACWGATECAKLLIERGVTVDARAADQSTPLCFAAEKGHLNICKMLIEGGASLESKNDPEEKGGATPLLLAAHNGQLEIVKLLIGKKANVKEKTIDGLNVLHLAIRSGSDNAELVKILIEGGAEVNGQTNNGDSSLHYAAFMGYSKIGAILLEKGADVEARGQNESTPLHFAAREGQTEIVRLLLQAGASIDSKDSDGDTPYQCAEINGHAACMELLKPQK